MNKYDNCFVPIPGFPGYETNLNGQVWSDRSGRLLAGGLNKQGYPQFSLQTEGREWKLCLHRVLAITFLGLNANSNLQADHRDEDKANNDISNIRIASRAENARNITSRRSNTSGHQGVSWDKESGNWLARIMLGGKSVNLGRFNDINEAAAARKAAEVKYFGTFRPGHIADQPANEEGAL